MKPYLLLAKFLRNPNLATWRALRKACVAKLPDGTFKDRKRGAV